MAAYTMMFVGMSPFGALLAGYTAAHFGAPAAVGGGGVLCLLASFVFASHLPVMRASAREEINARATIPIDLSVIKN